MVNVPKFIRKVKNRLNIFYLMSRYEKVYDSGECSLRYMFIPEDESDKLLIIFSAFPAANQSARYNYVTSFKNIKCNKLFILDNFGPNKRGGSYYLGKNRNFFVERAVNGLVSEIVSKLGITYKDVVSCGSSKGGYAALYFALKNGYGAAVVGAPQTLLGNYLGIKDHHCYLEYIAGGVSPDDKEFLNKLLFEAVINSKEPPEIFIHVGSKEHHYQEHVVPFVNYLKSNSISYDLDLKDYGNHMEVGTYFPPYALVCLEKFLNKDRKYDNKKELRNAR
ncbi:accessory Sec system protein Asp2 [Geobacillus subterraneus]|uniref:accessory Sec system protein Asp2 n=1 Tax=Geobacillus subterraneus TaxID=129338 RepID=UPI001442B5FD|nr:accessory Sec system protein Asp2 [Geobacillus subterraneus]QIZ66044.1 hypothetical protein HF500_01185 [Geobacillus subterraneus]